MALTDKFRNQAFALVNRAAELVRHAEERGGKFMPSEETELSNIEHSKLPIAWESYRLAVKRETGRLPSSTLAPSIQRVDGLSIRVAADVATIYLYGEFGPMGITSEDFAYQLTTLDRDMSLEVHVNSPGGYFHEAHAICGLIGDWPGPTMGVVDSVAASGGSLVLMGADEVVMKRGSTLMIHGARGSLREEPVQEFENAVARLRDVNETLLGAYSRRWNGTKAELQAALDSETWYTAYEAVRAGFADRVSNDLAVAARVDPGRFQNPPLAIAARANANCLRLRRARCELWRLAFDSKR